MRTAIWLLTASCLLGDSGPFGQVRSASCADRPNVVLINVDDLGYGDIGPFGNATQATPNLHRLASKGRKLKSHYGAPVCSPSRASLMTGCYPKRVLPIPHVLFPASAVGLDPDEMTVAEVLKQVGYATACIGKWHLGDQPEFLPTRQGFDYYFGLPYSNDMGLGEDGSKSNFGMPLPKPKAKNETVAGLNSDGLRGNQQPPLPLLENEQVIERVKAEEQATLTRRYTDKATDFIRKNKDGPFFLYFPHTAVHFPLYPSEDFRGTSKNGLFGDWVSEVDWSVGQILATLDELQIAESTLVIFTSDNGGATNHGSDNTPLRGSKGSTLEGGIRVPTICYWPGKIPAASETVAITSMMDVLPTVAHLAGAELPPNKLDGVNIWPIISGETDDKSGPRQEFLYFRGLELEAVRGGDWKLTLANSELYNLAEDIGESKNVARENPERVAALKEIVKAVEVDLGIKGIGPNCRKLGRVARPVPLLAENRPGWPMGRGDVAGTGATQESLPEPLDLLWELDLEGLGFDAGPIVADDKVFAADHDGRVLAIDLKTGKEVWKVKFETGFVASPAYRDGTLFVGDYDGTLHALDAVDGKEQWNYPTELEIDASPNFHGSNVLFTSQNGTLYAVDRATGSLAWEYETGDQLQCGATLAGDLTFLGGCDALLHIVDVNNGQAVGEPLPIDAPTGSTPSVLGDRVFVPTYAGEIFCFKLSTMELLWKFKDPELADEFKNSVAVADGLLVATSRNKRLFAIDIATGLVKWEKTLRKRSDASPVIAGQRVVVAAADGRIALFDLKTGEETWMFEVKPGFVGAPAVADGKLVVANDRGTVFCFGKK